MKKKKLHQPPAEMREAMALAPEERRRGRNWHHQGSDGYFGEDYYIRQAMRQATRRAHKIPISEEMKRKIIRKKIPFSFLPKVQNYHELRELCVDQLEQRGAPRGHGPFHWHQVNYYGQRLYSKTGADFIVVCLFAIFHDCCRTGDDNDPDHGVRGAEFAASLRGKLLRITPQQFELLERACIGHTAGITHNNPTIGTCWDADRLGVLPYGIIPTPELMSTAYGREVALSLQLRYLNNHGSSE